MHSHCIFYHVHCNILQNIQYCVSQTETYKFQYSVYINCFPRARDIPRARGRAVKYLRFAEKVAIKRTMSQAHWYSTRLDTLRGHAVTRKDSCVLACRPL